MGPAGELPGSAGQLGPRLGRHGAGVGTWSVSGRPWGLPVLRFASKSCFLKVLGAPGLRTGRCRLRGAWKPRCASRPAKHAQCLLGPPPLTSLSVSLPPGFFFFLIEFATTFHPGGLSSETLVSGHGAANDSCAGADCAEGDGQVQYGTLGPPTLPGTPASPEPAVGLPGLRGRAPFLHWQPPGPRSSGTAGRQGVRETAGTQVGFAKRLITRPGIVPTKPPGCPSQLPLPVS